MLAGELGQAATKLDVRRITAAGAADHGPLPADVDDLLALLDRVTNAVAAPAGRLPALAATGLGADILGGLVGLAKLVAGGLVAGPDSLPTSPALPAPGGVIRVPYDLDPCDARTLARVRGSIADGTADWVFGCPPEDRAPQERPPVPA